MFSVFMISRGRLAALTLLPAVFLCIETACQRVPLLAPSGSVISLNASTTVLPFNGTTTITAQVIEASGTPPHSGTHLTFTTTLGTIQPSDAETDTSGIVRVAFNAGVQSGTATITAISGGASVSATGAVKILVGSAAVGRVNVGASPATVPAVGGTTTISASVLDVNGNQLASVPVSFTTTSGTLSAQQVTTDANGIAQTSLTTFSSATVTASVGATGAPSTGGGTGTGTGGGTGTTTPATGTSGQASGTVVVNISAAPTLVITPPTSIPSVGLPASFTFAVTVPTTNGSAIRDLTVDWGDMTSQDLGAITGNAVVSHVYAAAGSYVVRGTVTDAFGNTVTASTAVSVITAASPTIIITPTLPSSCTAPVPGTAQASLQIQVTVPTGIGVVSVTVDFGDLSQSNLGGLNGTTTIPHSYVCGANPTVKVAVTDTLGRTTTGQTTFKMP